MLYKGGIMKKDYIFAANTTEGKMIKVIPAYTQKDAEDTFFARYGDEITTMDDLSAEELEARCLI